MRKLALVCVLVGMYGVAYGQQSAPGRAGYVRRAERLPRTTYQKSVPYLSKVPEADRLSRSTRPYNAVAAPNSTGNRLQHILQAATHLEAAGETDQARRLHQQADKEIQILVNRLDTLQAEVARLRHLVNRLETLQAEVARLRQVTGRQQQVLVKVKVMEVPRAKLRDLGFDFAKLSDADAGAYSCTATGKRETRNFLVLDDTKKLDGVLEALRQDSLVKVLAEPTVVTLSGRRATFHCGGDLPMLVPQNSGKVSIEHKKYGTEVDLVPIVLGNGRIRMEVRARHSKLDRTGNARCCGRTVPSLRTRQVEAGVEIQAGKTLVIGGLDLMTPRVIKKETDPKAKCETPKCTAADDKPEKATEETELLVLITPRIVEPARASSARVPATPKATR